MDPGRDITAQARKILKQSKPADSRPPDLKTGHRFQIAFYAAIAVFSMAVFFYGVIVDVLSIGGCWSNKPSIQPNGTFLATLFGGGSNMDYTVSLNAVEYGLNRTMLRRRHLRRTADSSAVVSVGFELVVVNGV